VRGRIVGKAIAAPLSSLTDKPLILARKRRKNLQEYRNILKNGSETYEKSKSTLK
jgi:adenine/guanine phosphoribosyltransferase-like PRPP-binding protein